LMFERGDPAPSDPHLSHVYGLALPLLKRGVPVAPVQLENVTLPGFLDAFKVLLLSYHGMKPLSAEVHLPVADWVRKGGQLIVVDDDGDPFNRVREWWNSNGAKYATPREDLFERMGWNAAEMEKLAKGQTASVLKGAVIWSRENPAILANNSDGDLKVVELVKAAASRSGLKWRETSHLLLRRGPYCIGAGLDESIPGAAKELRGRFVNLFDADLPVQDKVVLSPGSRAFLLDLGKIPAKQPQVLASACRTLVQKRDARSLTMAVEGVANTPAVVLLSAPIGAPGSVSLGGEPLQSFDYSAKERLLWIHFTNEPSPRELTIRF